MDSLKEIPIGFHQNLNKRLIKYKRKYKHKSKRKVEEKIKPLGFHPKGSQTPKNILKVAIYTRAFFQSKSNSN